MVIDRKNSSRKYVLVAVALALFVALTTVVLLKIISPKTSQAGSAVLPKPIQVVPADMSHPGMGTERLTDPDTLADLGDFPAEYKLNIVNLTPNALKKYGITALLSTETADWDFSRNAFGSEEYLSGKVIDATDRHVHVMYRLNVAADTFDVVYLEYDKKTIFSLLPDNIEPSLTGE